MRANWNLFELHAIHYYQMVYIIRIISNFGWVDSVAAAAAKLSTKLWFIESVDKTNGMDWFFGCNFGGFLFNAPIIYFLHSLFT